MTATITISTQGGANVDLFDALPIGGIFQCHRKSNCGYRFVGRYQKTGEAHYCELADCVPMTPWSFACSEMSGSRVVLTPDSIRSVMDYVTKPLVREV